MSWWWWFGGLWTGAVAVFVSIRSCRRVHAFGIRIPIIIFWHEVDNKSPVTREERSTHAHTHTPGSIVLGCGVRDLAPAQNRTSFVIHCMRLRCVFAVGGMVAWWWLDGMCESVCITWTRSHVDVLRDGSVRDWRRTIGPKTGQTYLILHAAHMQCHRGQCLPRYNTGWATFADNDTINTQTQTHTNTRRPLNN